MRKIKIIILAALAACLLAACGKPAPDDPNNEAEASIEAQASSEEDFQASILAGNLVELPSVVELDLDGDGKKEKLQFSINKEEDPFDRGYRLEVNGQEMTGRGCNLTGKLYGGSLCTVKGQQANEMPAIQLMVTEEGPSVDYKSYIYLYENDKLYYIGDIESWPEDVTVRDGSYFTARKRADTLQTWYREADYLIASRWQGAKASDQGPLLAEIPRESYSIGSIVTCKRSIPLQISRDNTKTAVTLKKGNKAILVSTDDLEWVFIRDADTGKGGWLRLVPDSFDSCIVRGKAVPSAKLFDGLTFYD